MQGLWAKTAASGFRMTAGTPSGRYGLPLGNRDGLALYPPAACGCLSQGRGGQVHPLRRGRRMWGRETGTTPRCATAALCRESGTARRRLDRTTVFSLFHNGMAVTAGAGPHHSA